MNEKELFKKICNIFSLHTMKLYQHEHKSLFYFRKIYSNWHDFQGLKSISHEKNNFCNLKKSSMFAFHLH